MEVVTPWVNGPLPRHYPWMQESRCEQKIDVENDMLKKWFWFGEGVYRVEKMERI